MALTSPTTDPSLSADSGGLRGAEAQRRLQQYGYNELAEEAVNPVLKFLSYFWGPIPWMIEVALVLSALVRHWTDLFIILALLVMNAVVGFWEEYQAGSTIAALKANLALQAQVKRDGAWTIISARELVPGDVIHLRLGEIVPADARLLPGEPLDVDQSALTGESLPVTHAAGDIVYASSVIQRGEVDAVVSATGKNSYMGKTAHLVQTAGTVSHFQRAVLKIGDYLIVLAIALVILILGVALFRGDEMLTTLQFALILTVAAIPVAMPAVLSVTMAVGARMLAARQVIVSHLASVEELAGMDLLCSDKTGTLTQNKLTLGEPLAVGNATRDGLILAAALASHAETRDPIDLAILGALQGRVLAGYTVSRFQPFDPVRKRTEASVTTPDGATFGVTKGAPQVILALAANAADIRVAVTDGIDQFAARGFRSLGVARTDSSGQWQFLGVLPLYDPPRPDARATLATARGMGVTVKLITGDQVAIGKEIARQVGLGTNVLDAAIFANPHEYTPAQLTDAIERADGFAQVFPEHKYRIVEALQARGHIVGMTGDGVNDAPALKKADAGIAVSGATDAARSAADIVLLTPGISVIIEAINLGRQIFERMTSYAMYRIAETLRVLLFMTLSILVFNFYPVTALMIVLLALLNDGAILSIAYDRARPAKKPQSWNMPLVLGVASVLGVAGVVASFGLFFLGERVFHLDRSTIQSLIYLKLSVAGHLTIFLTRTRGPFWSTRPSNILLAAVTGTQLVATLITVFGIFMTPIGWAWALAVWGYALVWFLVNDRIKLAAYRIFDSGEPGLLLPKRLRQASAVS